MDTKITLRAARYNAGYTLVEASNLLGINKDTLMKYERDSSDIPRSLMLKIPDIYFYPLDNIFLGVESDFIRNRKEKYAINDIAN